MRSMSKATVALQLACAVLVGTHTFAHAQFRLEAEYAITFARLPVGSITLTLNTGAEDYIISASARAGSLMRVLANGEASLSARGRLQDGRPVAAAFSSRAESGGAIEEVAMLLAEGNVKELKVTLPPGVEETAVSA